MKLYSSALCFGLLIMYCKDTAPKPPVVISDYCRQTAYAVAKIESLTPETIKALPRAQLQANASIVTKYRRNCKSG